MEEERRKGYFSRAWWKSHLNQERPVPAAMLLQIPLLIDLIPVGKGKIFKGPRSTFTNQVTKGEFGAETIYGSISGTIPHPHKHILPHRSAQWRAQMGKRELPIQPTFNLSSWKTQIRWCWPSAWILGSDENFSSFAIASTVGKLCLRESFKILSYLLHPGITKCFEDKPYDVYLLF